MKYVFYYFENSQIFQHFFVSISTTHKSFLYTWTWRFSCKQSNHNPSSIFLSCTHKTLLVCPCFLHLSFLSFYLSFLMIKQYVPQNQYPLHNFSYPFVTPVPHALPPSIQISYASQFFTYYFLPFLSDMLSQLYIYDKWIWVNRWK